MMLLLMLIADLLILSVHGWIVYKTTKIECFPNARYIRNATCGIKAVNRYRSHTNMESDIVNKLRNVSLNLQIFLRNSANKFKPFLVNVTANLCSILDKRNFPAYTTIVMNILKEVSNVNHSCPFTHPLSTHQQKRLIVKNLYMDEKFMPIVPPLGLYKIDFNFLEGYPYDDVGTVILYIQVTDVKEFKLRTKAPKFVYSTIIYKTLSIECKYNPEILTNVTCQLKPINWQKSVCIWDADIPHSLKNISIHLQLFKIYGANNFLPFLINTTLNMCDVLSKRSFSVYGKILFTILKETSNINHQCPHEEHLSLYNLYVDARLVPVTLPLGIYKAVVRFLEGYPQVFIGTTVLNLEAMEKRERRGKVNKN
ncbi:uncharacterized protein LOC105211853 [Zeugodacus cucurbitae]|uniref:uncharacterized protein LOC105211853 n=1 Tax=Zeugodacus cucurbitae TaxID=28588 RepID=UPI0023D91D86|nr:uncharacterized protein LOC105211853 [Zeugodacus cucurbitae]